MKKLLSLLIACFMIFALVGCVEEESEESTSSRDKNVSSEVSSGETSSEPEPQEKGKYQRGVSNENGWSSEWIGVKFTPNSSFVMSTEEELKALMEQAGEKLEDAGMDSGSIDYGKLTTVYEFMAVNMNGSNIIGMAEKLSLANMTEEQYVSALKANFELIQYEVTFSALEELKIGDTTFFKTESVLSIGTNSATQMYVLKKMGDRMICFILTEMQDGDFEKMLAMLSAI